MARQGNIVDFNEARAATSVRRAQSYADSWARSMDAADRRRPSATRRDHFGSLADQPQGNFSEQRAHRSFSSSRTGAYSGRNHASARTNSLASSYDAIPAEESFTGTFESAFSRGGSRTSSRDLRSGMRSTARGAERGSSSRVSLGAVSPSMSDSAMRPARTMPSWLSDAYDDLAVVKADDAGSPFAASRSASRTTSERRASYAADMARPSASPYGNGPRAAVFDEQSLREEDGGPGHPQEKGLLSRLKSRKRAATKERADRKFDRQFGDSNAQAGGSGPRAALYKGEMGQQQRYANRLQRDGDARTSSHDSYSPMGASTGRASEHTPRAKRMRHPVLKIGVAAVAVVICGALFMFPTLQSYYQTMREHDRIEAEYQAVEDRNAALQESIDDLSSDDGVAAYAHDQYGWVKSGEETAVVQGLELTEKDGLSNVNASVQTNAIQAPETWYSPVLDKVFGFEG